MIKVLSSTSEQPFYGVNFSSGKIVGGRTMSQVEVDTLVAHAKKNNLRIEE